MCVFYYYDHHIYVIIIIDVVIDHRRRRDNNIQYHSSRSHKVNCNRPLLPRQRNAGVSPRFGGSGAYKKAKRVLNFDYAVLRAFKEEGSNRLE